MSVMTATIRGGEGGLEMGHDLVQDSLSKQETGERGGACLAYSKNGKELLVGV